MKSNFIPKLETDKYYIGSFDAYINEAKKMLMKNRRVTEEGADEIIKRLPTGTRAAIVNKKTGEYVGYIGISDINGVFQDTDLDYSLTRPIPVNEVREIFEEYEKYLKDSLNVKSIERNNIEYNSSIILPPRYLGGEPSVNQINIVKNWGFAVPTLKYGQALFLDNKIFVGIIGLSGYNPSNKRANLNIYLDPNMPDDIRMELGIDIIDTYLDYAHRLNVHNIAASASKSSLDNKILMETNMQEFAEIPYTESIGNNIESRILYQHLPREIEPIDYDIKSYESIFDTLPQKADLKPKIRLNSDYKLISPKIFNKENIDLNHIIDGHIEAMRERDRFTIPLGEDKYFLQRGNDRYGIYKSVSNFSYVIVNNNGDYVGYVNILRSEGRHVEIEIGVSPKIQAKGIGRSALEAFYKELFRVGYASITSCVFSFNTPSLKLHDRVAEFNGIRIESYYANNRLWDMSYYTAVNPIIENGRTR